MNAVLDKMVCDFFYHLSDNYILLDLRFHAFSPVGINPVCSFKKLNTAHDVDRALHLLCCCFQLFTLFRI